MREDFNPLDLSPAPPPQVNTVVKAPKATVHRVSIGPLIRSKFVRLIVLAAILFFLAFGSYFGVSWYLLNRT